MEFSLSEVFIPHSKETAAASASCSLRSCLWGLDSGSGNPVSGGVWGGGGVETGTWEGLMMAGHLDTFSHKASSSPSAEGVEKAAEMKEEGLNSDLFVLLLNSYYLP